MGDIILEVDDVSFWFENKPALTHLTFQQRAGERIALAGQTGSGKTTLLKMVAGLLQPKSGTIKFLNDKIKGPDETLVPGHPQIAFLSQNFELPKFITVGQALEYANAFANNETAKVARWCKVDTLLNRKTHEISGGERQRVAIARLLLMQPRLLILDEPYSNLDIVQKQILKDVFNEVERRSGLSYILVSHDPHDALSWAHKILVLKNGKLIQSGTPHEIYAQPKSEYTAALFGTFLAADSALRKKLKIKSDYIRPEQLAISKSMLVKSVQGVVKESRFYGSYFEADVELTNSVVTVRHTKADIKEKDTVYVSFRG